MGAWALLWRGRRPGPQSASQDASVQGSNAGSSSGPSQDLTLCYEHSNAPSPMFANVAMLGLGLQITHVRT
jgi:hypothetical protein